MSVLNSIFSTAVGLWRFFGGKPKWSDVVGRVTRDVFDLVDQAITFGNMDNRKKFDDFLQALDLKTGADPGAVDMLKDVPADQEEVFWDHIVEAARVYGYCKLKIPGFFVE